MMLCDVHVMSDFDRSPDLMSFSFSSIPPKNSLAGTAKKIYIYSNPLGNGVEWGMSFWETQEGHRKEGYKISTLGKIKKYPPFPTKHDESSRSFLAEFNGKPRCVSGMFTNTEQHNLCRDVCRAASSRVYPQRTNTDEFSGNRSSCYLPCTARAQTSSRFSKMTSLIMGAATTNPDLTTVKARRLGVRCR